MQPTGNDSDATQSPSTAELDALSERLYPELRRLARAQLRRLQAGATLDTTALVHETYLKLAGSEPFADRAHFLAASARAMRHILVNAIRDRLTDKRGGGRAAVTLDGREVASDTPELLEILNIGNALEQLGRIDERLCRIVECRYFAGMTDLETSNALQVSERTVRRDWLRARAWLRDALGRIGNGDAAHAI